MNIRKSLVVIFLFVQGYTAQAKDYPSLFFGIKSDGITMNARSIQFGMSGIKFGTSGYGGFRDDKVLSNTVYNICRSAITLESVDGDFLEDILVDGLKSVHTGNFIFEE